MDNTSGSFTNAVNAGLGPLIGNGRTAEVFAWGDGQVLKLYRAGMPAQWVADEARVGRIVVDAGLAAPAIGDIVEVDGRLGVVYERLDGPSMLEYMAGHPAEIPALGRQFAELHAQMHDCNRPELPSEHPHGSRLQVATCNLCSVEIACTHTIDLNVSRERDAGRDPCALSGASRQRKLAVETAHPLAHAG